MVTIKAIKIGGSYLRTEDGNLYLIVFDDFYPVGYQAYWLLKKVGYYHHIIKVLKPSSL